MNERKAREAQRRAQERVLEQKEDEAIAKYLQEQQQRSSFASTQNEPTRTSKHEAKTLSTVSSIKQGQYLNKVEVPNEMKSVKAKTQRVLAIKPPQVKSLVSASCLNVD